MIGLDTDFLLRLRLNDDPAQNKRIDVLFRGMRKLPGVKVL